MSLIHYNSNKNQLMEVLPLKEKLLKSRKLWNEIYHSHFLADLYEILDVNEITSQINYHLPQCPRLEEIIDWSKDGKMLLIKRPERVEEDILPYFEMGATVSSFYKNVKGFF